MPTLGHYDMEILTRRMFKLAGLINLVIMAWFFMSVAFVEHAHAGEAGASCSGENLLVKMKSENPEAYARVVKAAEDTPNGQATLWKIEKEGLAPSYVLGTMHVSDPRVTTLPDDRKELLDNSKTVLVELAEAGDPSVLMAKMAQVKDLTMLTDGSTLDTMVSKELLGELEKEVTARSIPFFLAKRMKPWFIASAIGLPMCEMQRKAQGAEVLDAKIINTAKANGQKLVGLETLEEQLNIMAGAPLKLQVKGLEDSLKLGSETRDNVVFTMIDLYVGENIARFMPFSSELAVGFDESPEGTEFEKKLITDRNHLMVERAAPHFAEGGAFMAIGALHLPGKEGIIELLKKQGYKATPMPKKNTSTQ